MGIVNIRRKATLRQSQVRRRSGTAPARIVRKLGIADRTLHSALHVQFTAVKQARQRPAYRARPQRRRVLVEHPPKRPRTKAAIASPAKQTKTCSKTAALFRSAANKSLKMFLKPLKYAQNAQSDPPSTAAALNDYWIRDQTAKPQRRASPCPIRPTQQQRMTRRPRRSCGTGASTRVGSAAPELEPPVLCSFRATAQ